MSRATQRSFIVAALATLALSGCATPSLRRSRPSETVTAAAASASSWATTLIAAQRDVERGRHAEADRALREFGERTAPSQLRNLRTVGMVPHNAQT